MCIYMYNIYIHIMYVEARTSKQVSMILNSFLRNYWPIIIYNFTHNYVLVENKPVTLHYCRCLYSVWYV